MAMVEANQPKPRRRQRPEPNLEPDWKDTDPPFMRKVWEAEGPATPEPGTLAASISDEARIARIRRRHEKRKAYARKSHANRRARKAGAAIGDVDRAAIIERDASTCYLCGKACEPAEIHLDHIVPLSRGGAHHPDNLGVACSSCNVRKGTTLTTLRPIALRDTTPVDALQSRVG